MEQVVTLLIYFIFDCLSLLFMYKFSSVKDNKKKKLMYIVLSFLPLFILLGFRHISVGTDTHVYADTFERVVHGTMSTADKNWLSIGYITLSYIVGHIFGTNYVVLNVVVGFLSLFFLYKSIVDNSKIPTLSLFLFICMCLYYQMFNQSRQLLAITIVMYSYKYLKHKNFFKYAITVLFAATMHKSALIMLPVYFFVDIKLTKRNLLIYSGLGVFILLFSGLFVKLITMTSYGKIYAGTSFFESQLSTLFNLFVRVGLLGLCLLAGKNYIKKDSQSCRLYNIAILCTLLQIIAVRVGIFARIVTYFFVFYVFLIPEIISHVSKRYQEDVLEYTILLFTMYHFVYYAFRAIDAGYNIYRFFWL